LGNYQLGGGLVHIFNSKNIFVGDSNDHEISISNTSGFEIEKTQDLNSSLDLCFLMKEGERKAIRYKTQLKIIDDIISIDIFHLSVYESLEFHGMTEITIDKYLDNDQFKLPTIEVIKEEEGELLIIGKIGGAIQKLFIKCKSIRAFIPAEDEFSSRLKFIIEI
jgi:hypothetical protein